MQLPEQSRRKGSWSFRERAKMTRRAFVYYFTHPGRISKTFTDNVDTRRSVIQVAELEYKNGTISVNRDKPVYIQLAKQAINKRK